MLVLARRESEEIVIRVPGRPTPIVVRVAAIRGERVRIGITADRDIKADRREVYEAEQAELKGG